jgi:hypothetical protein
MIHRSNIPLHKPLSRLQEATPESTPCLFCRAELDPPRRGKHFCSDLCRSRFHHAQRQARQAALEQELEETKRLLAALRVASAGVPSASRSHDPNAL